MGAVAVPPNAQPLCWAPEAELSTIISAFVLFADGFRPEIVPSSVQWDEITDPVIKSGRSGVSVGDPEWSGGAKGVTPRIHQIGISVIRCSWEVRNQVVTVVAVSDGIGF